MKNWEIIVNKSKEEILKKYNKMKTKPYEDLLKANKNLILTGAPGTGKTHLAIEIAEAITGVKKQDKSEQIGFVQFHPSFDYTDFVEGLRPTPPDENGNIGFELKDGVFKAFCKKAKDDPENKYVFIIDEINRAELSKVFGELFFSIDPDYRGKKWKVTTQYANLIDEDDLFKDGFYVPENVYIIGTMNDIDRSVESFDFAMRRRFAWEEIKPEDTRNEIWAGKIDKWSEEAGKKMKALNDVIKNIPELGEHYKIGAAYFLKLQQYNGNFNKLWENHLKGLLREYLRGLPKIEVNLKKLKDAYDNDGK